MPVEPFIGEIRFWARVNLNMPDGWLACNGGLYPVAQYAALFSIIGTRYGGNGTTDFAVPTLVGQALMGTGNGPGLTPRPLGASVGTNSVLQNTQLPLHSHKAALANVPTLKVQAASDDGDSSLPPAGGYIAAGRLKAGLAKAYYNQYIEPAASQGTAYLGGLTITGTTQIDPAGQTSPLPRENRQPQLLFSFFIAAEGIYPTRP